MLIFNTDEIFLAYATLMKTKTEKLQTIGFIACFCILICSGILLVILAGHSPKEPDATHTFEWFWIHKGNYRYLIPAHYITLVSAACAGGFGIIILGIIQVSLRKKDDKLKSSTTKVIKAKTSLEQVMPKPARKKKKQKEGFIDRVLSWIVAFIFTSVGVMWIIVTIVLVILVIVQKKWLYFWVPPLFFIAGAAPIWIASLCLKFFIEKIVDVLKGDKRCGRVPDRSEYYSNEATKRDGIVLPNLWGWECILVEDQFEYRGELSFDTDTDKERCYIIFSTCLGDNDVITEYLRIPASKTTAVRKGWLFKKTIIRTVDGKEYVFAGDLKDIPRLINDYYSRF